MGPLLRADSWCPLPQGCGQVDRGGVQRPRIPAAGEGVDRRGMGCNRAGGFRLSNRLRASCVPWGGPQDFSPSLLTRGPGGHRDQRRESEWKGSSPEPRGCSEARSEEGPARPEGQRLDSGQRDGDLILWRRRPQPSPQAPRGAQHTAPVTWALAVSAGPARGLQSVPRFPPSLRLAPSLPPRQSPSMPWPSAQGLLGGCRVSPLPPLGPLPPTPPVSFLVPTARPSSQICGCYRSVLWDGLGGTGPLQRPWGGPDDETRAACEG